MQKQKPVPTQHHGTRSSHVPDALKCATIVFVRHDAVKPPYDTQRPYDGPFLVVTRREKYFTINRNGCNITVSIDRLKAAFILTDQKDDEQPPKRPPPRTTPTSIAHPVPMFLPTPPTVRTRSGRAVNLPVRFRTGGSTVAGNIEQTT